MVVQAALLAAQTTNITLASPSLDYLWNVGLYDMHDGLSSLMDSANTNISNNIKFVSNVMIVIVVLGWVACLLYLYLIVSEGRHVAEVRGMGWGTIRFLAVEVRGYMNLVRRQVLQADAYSISPRAPNGLHAGPTLPHDHACAVAQCRRDAGGAPISIERHHRPSYQGY